MSITHCIRKKIKKSEEIVLQNPENLVLRLGPIYGENLDKGANRHD